MRAGLARDSACVVNRRDNPFTRGTDARHAEIRRCGADVGNVNGGSFRNDGAVARVPAALL